MVWIFPIEKPTVPDHSHPRGQEEQWIDNEGASEPMLESFGRDRGGTAGVSETSGERGELDEYEEAERERIWPSGRALGRASRGGLVAPRAAPQARALSGLVVNVAERGFDPRTFGL